MKIADFVVIILLLLLICYAVICIQKTKKQGKSCLGCPYSDSCGGRCDHD